MCQGGTARVQGARPAAVPGILRAIAARSPPDSRGEPGVEYAATCCMANGAAPTRGSFADLPETTHGAARAIDEAQFRRFDLVLDDDLDQSLDVDGDVG